MTPAQDMIDRDEDEGRLAQAKAQVIERAGAAREAAASAIDTARDKATDLYATTRDKAGDAYTAARARAAELSQQAAEGVQGNPLVVVVGGVALGAILGLLAPRSRREAELLRPIGARVVGLAEEAVAAAKGAGQDKLAELGLTREAARAKFAELLDAGKQVAGSAGEAAAGAVRKPTE